MTLADIILTIHLWIFWPISLEVGEINFDRNINSAEKIQLLIGSENWVRTHEMPF